IRADRPEYFHEIRRKLARSGSGLAMEHAVLHDQLDLADARDLASGVALDGHEVGPEARLDPADLVAEPEDLRGRRGRGPEGVHGGHAAIDHQFQFPSEFAVRERPDVAAVD